MDPKTPNRAAKEQPRTDESLIIGRNAVREALKSGRPVNTLLVKKGERTGALLPLIAECKERNIPVKEVDVKKLDFMCGHQNHQGVLLLAAAADYSTVEDIFAVAEERGEPPFLILCDGIEDPHNLGAIIRSAEAGGAHGMIIPERRNASLTGIVGKTSAGALEYLKVARVKNLNNTVKELKERGVWVYAADMEGESYLTANLSGPVALVIGSEGKGVSRLTRELCDGCVSIPMHGSINSLNASVAAAILIFKTAEQREANERGN